MRHHKHPPHPPRNIALFYGIHQKLLGVVWLALGLGGIFGVALHTAAAEGLSLMWLACGLSAALFFSWPLSWMATFRVVRPLKDLARVASELRRGHLDQRSQLISASGEVGEVSLALRSVADRLSQQLEDQKALMAAVSHELRSPLARVAVLIDLLREDRAPDTLPDSLEEEVRAMDHLVGDLLAAARIDFDAVRPMELLLDDLFARAIELSRIEVTLPQPSRCRGHLGSVRGDPTLLVRALSALLDNAHKHGGPDISIELSEREDIVRITVCDSGQGFSEAEQDKLFTPFWRGPTTKGRDKPSGVGLGLSLVRRIARAHGGEAGVDIDQGGRVWIELPRA